MPNEPEDHPTEPLVPGMQAEPVEHGVGAGAGAGATLPPANSAPTNTASGPSRWSLAEAWSGRRPGTFVGLVALAAVLAVVLVAGCALQANAVTRLASGVGLRLHGPGATDHRPFGNPDRRPAPRDRNRQEPGEGGPGPRQFGQVPGLTGLGQAEHGDIAVGSSGQTGATTVRFARGQVSAVSATTLSVKCADGFSIDFVVNSNTKVRAGRPRAVGPQRNSENLAPNRPGDAGIADIKVGDTVMSVGTVSGSTVTATLISLIGSEGQSNANPGPTAPTT